MPELKISRKQVLSIFACVFIGFATFLYHSFTTIGVEKNSLPTTEPKKVLNNDNLVSKQSWDTISNKTELIDQMNQLQKDNNQNATSFHENMDPSKKISADYIDSISKKPVLTNEPVSHKKSLQERLNTEVARDNQPQEYTPRPVSNNEPKAETNKNNADFQFGGFVVEREPKRNVPLKTKTEPGRYDATGAPLDMHSEEGSQAIGVVTKRTKIFSNSSLSIKLSEDLKIASANITVPAGTEITALTYLSGQRVMGKVEGLNVKGKIIRVNLNLYDNDGNEGLTVGALKKDVNSSVRSGIDNAISTGTSALGMGTQLIGGVLSSVNRNTNKAEAIVPQGYVVIVKE